MTTTYAYDEADRLLTEDAAGALTTYSWDDAGNNTLMESAGGRTTMTWDAENRMRSIQAPGGSVVTNTYGADGLRRKREEGAATVKYLWDGQRLLQETDSSGTTQAQYTAGLGTYGPMLSQRRSGASAAAIDTHLLDAFGSLIASTGSTVNPHRYIGQQGYYTEPALTLDYVRARWLRPTTGSWLSVDPVPGEPRYQYVGARPTWAVDGGGGQFGLPFPQDPFASVGDRAAAQVVQQYFHDLEVGVGDVKTRVNDVATGVQDCVARGVCTISPRIKPLELWLPVGPAGVGGSCYLAWRYDRDAQRWESAWICSVAVGKGGGAATGAGLAWPVDDLGQHAGWGWGTGAFSVGGVGGNLWPQTPFVVEGQIGQGGELGISCTWVYKLPEPRRVQSYGPTPEALDQYPPPGYDPSKPEWHS